MGYVILSYEFNKDCWIVVFVCWPLDCGLYLQIEPTASPGFVFLLRSYCCLDLFIHSRTALYGRKVAWVRHKVFNRSPMSSNSDGLVVLLKPVLNELSKWVQEVKQHEQKSPKVNCPYCIGIKYTYRELIKLFICSLIAAIWVAKLRHILSNFFSAPSNNIWSNNCIVSPSLGHIHPWGSSKEPLICQHSEFRLLTKLLISFAWCSGFYSQKF